jgi:AcrR family transcriptional regulator
MPKVSYEHEQAVRNRIIDASINVFGRLGYERASIQDVVRESGLSVGAVYTYFKGKEDLFLTACACEAERESDRLRLELAEIGGLPDRLKAAVDWAVDMAMAELSTKGAMIHAWARADTTPELQAMLQQRRDESVVFARRLLDDAAGAGELPAWIDRDALASAFITLTNGFIVLANSGAMGPEQARREAYAILELLLAAPTQPPAAVEAVRAAAPAR